MFYKIGPFVIKENANNFMFSSMVIEIAPITNGSFGCPTFCLFPYSFAWVSGSFTFKSMFLSQDYIHFLGVNP